MMKVLLRLRSNCAICAFATLGLVHTPGEAVDIYRIGGENLPVPELSESLEIVQVNWSDLPLDISDGDSRFIQLPWAATDEEKFGNDALVIFSADNVAPERFDPGTNLTPFVRARGGTIESTDGYFFKDEDALDFMFDEDPTTAYSGGGSHYSYGGESDRILWTGSLKILRIDLGGPLPISRIVMYPTVKYENERFVKEFLIATNDGDPRMVGQREARTVAARNNIFVDYNLEDIILNTTTTGNRLSTLDLEVPAKKTQVILLVGRIGTWEIAEFEIYGDGYVSEANYRTNIIDLGTFSTLGDLTWSGDVDEGARLDLTIRSGDSPDPNLYWRNTFRGDERSILDDQGKTLTRTKYDGLESGEKGGISPDTENWQFWSTPLEFDSKRSSFAANRPRQYVQVDAIFTTEFSQAASKLDFLEFRVSSPPMISDIVAEIDPPVVSARAMTEFRYLVLPRFGEDDGGFNSIRVTTGTDESEVVAVYRNRTDENDPSLSKGEWSWEPKGDGFVVTLNDKVGVDDTNELIEIVFRSEVFEFGTVFEGIVFDSARPEEPGQPLAVGDADPLVDSNTLSIGLTDIGQNSVQALSISPQVWTPNGDGVNDVLDISFDLINLNGDVPVSLGLHDLSGRQVAVLFEGFASSGRQTMTWPTAGAEADPPVPGSYILRLDVEADTESRSELGILSIAY